MSGLFRWCVPDVIAPTWDDEHRIYRDHVASYAWAARQAIEKADWVAVRRFMVRVATLALRT